jgi:DNA-binding beta-propeller fold protein YncE
VAISPANSSVAIALGTGGTNVFAFSASSATPWGATPKANAIDLLKNSTTDNAVSFDTTSTYLFIAESTSSTTADTLRKLTLATLNGEVDYPTGKGPTGILADASGAYVYVTNETDNTISGFSLAAGALTALTDSPFATAKAPTAIAEDSTKTYVVTVGYGNNPNLWLYTFDALNLGTLDVGATTTTGTVDPSLANGLALSH